MNETQRLSNCYASFNRVLCCGRAWEFAASCFNGFVIMSKFIELKESKKQTLAEPYHTIKPVKKSLPFIESFRGYYAHRVKHVDMHTNYKNKSHFAIKTWCGMSFNNGGGGKGQTFFTENPTNNKPICATCEGKFIGSGQGGDRIINGNKVMYQPHGYGEY